MSWGAGMTLASHQWDRGSIQGQWVCGWFLPCSDGFSPVFLPPQKPTSPTTRGPAWKPAKADVASSLNILILIATKDRRVSRGQKSLNACFKVDIEASCCEVWAKGDNRFLDDFGWATRQSHRKFYEWLIKGIEAGRVLTALPLKTPSHFQPYDYLALLMATQTSVASSVRKKNLG